MICPWLGGHRLLYVIMFGSRRFCSERNIIYLWVTVNANLYHHHYKYTGTQQDCCSLLFFQYLCVSRTHWKPHSMYRFDQYCTAPCGVNLWPFLTVWPLNLIMCTGICSTPSEIVPLRLISHLNNSWLVWQAWEFCKAEVSEHAFSSEGNVAEIWFMKCGLHYHSCWHKVCYIRP